MFVVALPLVSLLNALAFIAFDFPLLAFPYGWGESMLFRVSLVLLLGIFLWHTLFMKGRIEIPQPAKKNLLFYVLIAFIGILSLSTLFSVDPSLSFWGDPIRSGGFLNLSFLALLGALAFLLLSPQQWQRIWDVAIFVAVIVSIAAILQRIGLLDVVLPAGLERPGSAIGGPVFLAVYLLLFAFLPISFAFQSSSLKKRIWYEASAIIILFVIVLTLTRAAYLGLAIEMLWFVLFFPSKANIAKLVKIAGAIGMFIGVSVLVYANVAKDFPEFIEDNSLLSAIIERLSLERVMSDPRFSSWSISLPALFDRPLLGYGLENYSVGFDKHFDPSLQGFEIDVLGSNWWDRAHNILFDIGVSAGVFALLLFIALFGMLLVSLQKMKKEALGKAALLHGLQATLLAYFVTDVFSIDTFPSFLVFFLLVGYVMHLTNMEKERYALPLLSRSKYAKIIAASALLIFFLWFVWTAVVQPVSVNAKVKLAKDEAEALLCGQALARMADIVQSSTWLDQYVHLKYVEVLGSCISELPAAERVAWTERLYELLGDTAELRPMFTRTWMSLGTTAVSLAEESADPQSATQYIQETETALERALQLSPKRQEIWVEWAKKDIVQGEYEKAKEKAQSCVELNQEFGDCYWAMALANISTGEFEEAEKQLSLAREKPYWRESKEYLLLLAEMYAAAKNYDGLIPVYQKLFDIDQDIKYRVGLAAAYKEIGDITKARQEASFVLNFTLKSGRKLPAEIEQFLRSF